MYEWHFLHWFHRLTTLIIHHPFTLPLVSYPPLSLTHTSSGAVQGVTMGWLLRLVTGGPLVVGGPRQF